LRSCRQATFARPRWVRGSPSLTPAYDPIAAGWR
jgi:hypothetical protein